MTDQTVVPPSESTPRRSRPMQLVGERRLPDPVLSPQASTRTTRTTSTPSTTTSPEPHEEAPPAQLSAYGNELLQRNAWKRGVLGAVNVFALILAARMIVLVSVAGGIFLTWTALEQPDLFRLIAVGTYCVAVVIPCVWLASRGK